MGIDDEGEKLAWTSCLRRGGFHASNGVDDEWEKQGGPSKLPERSGFHTNAGAGGEGEKLA